MGQTTSINWCRITCINSTGSILSGCGWSMQPGLAPKLDEELWRSSRWIWGKFCGEAFPQGDAQICCVDEKKSVNHGEMWAVEGNAPPGFWRAMGDMHGIVEKIEGFYLRVQILTVQVVMIAQNPMWFFDCSNVVPKNPQEFLIGFRCWDTLLPWKLTNLKINRWKMKFLFEMVLFWGTCYFSGGPPCMAIGKWNYAAVLVQLNSSSLFWGGMSCGETLNKTSNFFWFTSKKVRGNGCFPIWLVFFNWGALKKCNITLERFLDLKKKGPLSGTLVIFSIASVDGLWKAVVWTHDFFGWLFIKKLNSSQSKWVDFDQLGW